MPLTIPDPPINAPFVGTSPSFGTSELCGVNVWTYQVDRGGWSYYGVQNFAADDFPLGFYRTPLDYTGIPAFFLVSLRVGPGGVGLPYVTAPQDSPLVQAINCPDGFGLVDPSEVFPNPPGDTSGVLDPWFNQIPVSQLCARLAVQKVPTCPPGTVWDPNTETCIPIVPPPPPPVCPPGTHWDLATETCVPDTPPPPPPTCPPGTHWDPSTETCQPDVPPPPPTPCYPDTTPGDELTLGLNCVIENLIFLQYQLSQLLQGQNGQPVNTDPVTCTQLTGLVTATNQSLLAIAQMIAALGHGAPIDFSQVTAALLTIAGALQSYPPLWKACCDEIQAQLTAIATNIAEQQPTDVSGIVKELDRLFTTIDVPLPVYEQLESDGWISAETLSLLGQGEFGTGIITVFKDYVTRGIAWLIKEVESPAGPSFAPVFRAEDGIAKFLAGIVDLTLNAAAVPFYPVIKAGIDGVALQLEPSQPPVIGDVFVDEDLLITKTLGPALILNSIMLIAGYFGWNTSEQLAEYVDIASGVLGLEEVKEFTIGQRMAAGPVKQAELEAKALYRQELPGASTLFGLVAQGLFDRSRALNLVPYTGTPAELQGALEQASYRGLNARQMLRLIETDLFSASEIADELTFSGMRPVSQSRMLRAAPYLATASERSSLRAELETAYATGLLSDADLQSQVLAIEQNTDLAGLVLSRARLQKLIAETKALETEYTSLFIGGLIDDVTYRDYLAALGLQPDMINTIAGRAEARANVTTNRKNIAEAAREARALQKAIDQTAIRNFEAGNIDAAALSAALIASGLPVSQVASLTDLAALRKAGSLRWIFGLQLLPNQAALLRDRVAALTDQRKRQLLTDDQYVAQLRALGIPDRYVNYLQAAADALISPKTAASLVPVQTG